MREFRSSAIADILDQNYVEARLHTDGGDTPERREARTVQWYYAYSVANPWLVVVDPETGDKVSEVGFLEGSDLELFLKKNAGI